MHKKKHTLAAALWVMILTLFSVQCTIDVAGGGADIGNPVVAGTLVTSSDDPAIQTVVLLIPDDYNPVENNSSTVVLFDTTDITGAFFFEIENFGTYNLMARHLILQERLLHTGITIQTKEDTMQVNSTLTEPGAVEIIFSDTVDTAERYLFIPGTNIYAHLSDATKKGDNSFSLVLDSLPAGIVPEFYYAKVNESQTVVPFTDSLQVASNDTVVFIVQPSWLLYTSQSSGLPRDTVYSVYIEPDGTGWFGTFGGGVASYDGTTWTSYTSGNSDLPNNVVLSIAQTGNGSLWFGTAYGVASFDGTAWEVFDSATSDFPGKACFEMKVKTDNTVWFATDYGLTKYDGSTWVVYDSLNSELPRNWVSSISFDKQGFLWIAMEGGGLSRFDEGANSWVHYTTANSDIPGDFLYCTSVDKQGNVWVGGADGLGKFDGTTWTVYNTGNSLLPDQEVWALSVDNSNAVWAGTPEGTVRIQQGKLEVFTTANSEFLSNHTFATTADNKGNTWFGTGHGVIRYGLSVK